MIGRTWGWLAAVVILLISWRFYVLQSPLSGTDDNNSGNKGKIADTSGNLFQALLDHKLLEVSAGGLLGLPAADKAIAEAQHSGVYPAYAPVLESLYTKVQGEQVRQQVALWNLGHQLAAIRDDRTAPDGSGVDDGNVWKVSDQQTGRMLDSVALLPAEFVYVGGELLRPGFHDWRTGHSRKGNPLLFESEISNTHGKPLPVTIQIIGTVDEKALLADLARFKPKLQPRRPPGVCGDVPVQAWELELTIPPKQLPTPLRIPVKMTYTSAQRLDGIAICMTSPDAVLLPGQDDPCLAKPPKIQQEERASSNTTADSEVDVGNGAASSPENRQVEAIGLAGECHRPTLANHVLHWQASRLYTRAGKQIQPGEMPTYTLYTLDAAPPGKPTGEALTTPPDNVGKSASDRMGEPTAQAEALGLLPLIGQDRHDRYALSGILNATRLPDKHTDVYLTIDSRMQKIALDVLIKNVKGQNNPNAAGALVLLNPQTGAILAAAHASPHDLPRHVHSWDRNAFSQVYPTKDPTQFNPWQGETGFNAPGSTFKLVTALAGLSAIRDGHPDHERLETMMAGVKRESFQAITGLNPDAVDFSHVSLSKPVNNFGRIPLSNAFATAQQVGLREALRDSINNWFMQLVFNMDFAATGRPDHDGDGQPDLQLAAMVKLLGFGGYTDLAPASLKLERVGAGQGGRGDVLNALGGHLGIQRMKLGEPVSLGPLMQNSIGQDMTTSPLQMAKVAASVATGKNIQPHLLAWWNGDDLYAGGGYLAAADLDLPHLDWVHAGMKAVVGDGTAKGRLGQFAPHVYGKTGTAQAKPKGEPMQDVAWFIGFYTQGKPEEATLAFACQIMRANSGGGRVCAPAIREVLAGLAKAQLLGKSHAQ